MIYLLISCNTEERTVQNTYIQKSNRTHKRTNYNSNNNTNPEMDRLNELQKAIIGFIDIVFFINPIIGLMNTIRYILKTAFVFLLVEV